MKILLRLHWRLGDIVRIFPIAARLAAQGNEVSIACHEKFASILKLISYAKWYDPRALTTSFEVVHSVGIWPGFAYEYRCTNPPKKFLDFVVSKHAEEFKGTRREIVFDQLPPLEPILKKYGLPPQYSLACPIGFTDSVPDDRPCACEIDFMVFEAWLNNVVKPRGDVFMLAHRGFPINRRFVTVESLDELATLIHHAIDFATILSAPAVIASAQVGKKPLRESWHYVAPTNPRERAQDDIAAKEQVRWEVDYNSSTPRIVRQKS